MCLNSLILKKLMFQNFYFISSRKKYIFMLQGFREISHVAWRPLL